MTADVPVLGVVPVVLDDEAAPFACAALRVLRGHSLVARAIGALRRSAVVDRIVVVAPAVLVPALREVVALLDPRSTSVEVLGVPAGAPATLPDLVGAALTAGAVDPAGAVHTAVDLTTVPGTVVVHDPLHPLAPSSLVRLVVADLQRDADCVAVVPVRQVTDTLKWVDHDDIVITTADRETYRVAYSPQAFRAAPLEAALSGGAGPAGGVTREVAGVDVLPRLLQAAGGRVVCVAAPGEVFRIASQEDLFLSEAMLHVGADVDDERAF